MSLDAGEGRMTAQSILVFDMDGVLAEVGESYSAATVATVQHFTGEIVSRERIEEFKEAGGWNNDWALSHHLIQDIGSKDVAYKDVLAVFQSVFLGQNNDGLILREKWIPANGLLERLREKYELAIFTGRPRAEIEPTLARFAPAIPWAVIIADEEVARAKPAPDGLLAIANAYPKAKLTYIGDNVDDARSARTAAVRFIGVADLASARRARLLQAEGAVAVVADVNALEGVL